jgi:quercetin dioxygenase-like cupin family protein
MEAAMLRQLLALAAGVTLIGLGAAEAQPSAVHKVTLQTQAFPGPTYHTVTVRTAIDRGGEVAPHTHPGAEMAYVLKGQGRLKVAGGAGQALKAGVSFAIPPGTAHSVRNTGAGQLVIVSTYVVDKSKPIATPAAGR